MPPRVFVFRRCAGGIQGYVWTSIKKPNACKSCSDLESGEFCMVTCCFFGPHDWAEGPGKEKTVTVVSRLDGTTPGISWV